MPENRLFGVLKSDWFAKSHDGSYTTNFTKSLGRCLPRHNHAWHCPPFTMSCMSGILINKQQNPSSTVYRAQTSRPHPRVSFSAPQTFGVYPLLAGCPRAFAPRCTRVRCERGAIVSISAPENSFASPEWHGFHRPRLHIFPADSAEKPMQ